MVNIFIVAVSFAATLLNYLTGGRSGLLLFMTYHSSLLSPMTWIRMFTHIFGHADWSHLIGNMSYLLLLGPMLEEKYSSRVLLEVILVTAFVTGLANYILFPATALCGASVVYRAAGLGWYYDSGQYFPYDSYYRGNDRRNDRVWIELQIAG